MKQKTKNEIVVNFVESEDWKTVKESLLNKIDALKDIRLLSQGSDTAIANEVRARTLAAVILEGWLGEIEGTATFEKRQLLKEKESYIVTRE